MLRDWRVCRRYDGKSWAKSLVGERVNYPLALALADKCRDRKHATETAAQIEAGSERPSDEVRARAGTWEARLIGD